MWGDVVTFEDCDQVVEYVACIKACQHGDILTKMLLDVKFEDSIVVSFPESKQHIVKNNVL